MRSDRGHTFTAQCPAHNDQHPSLDITTGKDSRALLICRSNGCTTEDIVAALGLTLTDLFATTSSNGNDHKTSERPLDAGQPRQHQTDYLYTVNGEPLIRKRRYRLADGTKTFTIQHRTTVDAAWKTGQGGLTPDPYRWADIADTPPMRMIFIVEGEKDADRLHQLGLAATTNIGGAAPPNATPKWPTAWGQQFFAGRQVCIIPDNDPPGHAHAEAAAHDLRGHAATLRIINLPGLPDKGDVSDWLDNGHPLDDLKQLVATTPLWTPPPPPQPQPSRFRLVTVQELLALPDPEWLIDGILPHGTVGMITGLPGSGKSYLSLDIACTVADNTRHRWGSAATKTGLVVYITGEGQWGLGQRVEAWQTGHPDSDLSQLRFVTAMPAAAETDQVNDLLAEIDAVAAGTPPILVVFDTLARLAIGLEENSASDMGRLIGVVEAIRDRYACSVALIHHTRKDGTTYRGSSAIQGAVSWQWAVVLNNVTEPNYIRVECERQKDAHPFDPITLHFEKWDETGYLVVSARPAFSDRDVRLINALIDTPEATPPNLTDTQFPWFSPPQIRPADIHTKTWRRGIKALVTQGFLEEQGTNRHLTCRWTEFAAFTLPKLQNVREADPVSASRISPHGHLSPPLGGEGVREMSANPDPVRDEPGKEYL